MDSERKRYCENCVWLEAIETMWCQRSPPTPVWKTPYDALTGEWPEVEVPDAEFCGEHTYPGEITSPWTRRPEDEQ